MIHCQAFWSWFVGSMWQIPLVACHLLLRYGREVTRSVWEAMLRSCFFWETPSKLLARNLNNWSFWQMVVTFFKLYFFHDFNIFSFYISFTLLMEEIWRTTCYTWNPMKRGRFSISTGAGFLPSTVSLEMWQLLGRQPNCWGRMEMT